MKSSLQFREERCPLLRAKLPFTVGGIPLSSGIALGNGQDLAVHVGTFFPAGPSFKLAFKPNDPVSPFSLILKTGLGLWGSPNGAALALTAEFHFASKGGDHPFFSLRVKPRTGDFSIRKDVNLLQTSRQKALVPVQSKEDGAQSQVNGIQSLVPLPNGTTPQKFDNGTPSSPLSNGDTKGIHKRSAGSEKDKLRSPSADSNNVVIGSNFSLKIEGLDRDWKGRGDRKQKIDGLKDQETDSETGLGGNCVIVDVPDDILQEQMKMELQKSGEARSMSVEKIFRGSKIIAYSSLPLGKQALLNVRWGVKPPPELFQGWESSWPPFSFSKLPFLLLDKISLQSVAAPPEKPKDVSPVDNSGYLERGLLPVSFVEENRELAQVAAVCYSMKRQLHLLHAENKVLRRAMEEMRSQVEYRGSMGAWKPGGDLVIEEQTVPRPPLLDSPMGRKGREDYRQDVEVGKGQRNGPRKDAHTESKGSNSDTPDVSEELKKAIMSAKNGSARGMTD